MNETNIKVTALLLNWKRPENIIEVIKSIRSQSIKIEIWLWNNNFEDTTQYDVDMQINSSNNFKCWPRWLIGSMVDDGYIFTLDDDIMFNKTDVIENCIKIYESIDQNDLNPIIGFSGVQLNDTNTYWESTHINKPDDINDIFVDVVKGRFMFMDCKILKTVNMENEPTCEDIKISSYSKYKVIPTVLKESLVNLKEGKEALHSSLEQRNKRDIAVKKYFL